MKNLFLSLLLILISFFSLPAWSASPNWDSLWSRLVTQDATQWQDENEKPTHIIDYAKNKIVLTMAYSECKKTCPMVTLAKLKEIQTRYDKEGQAVDFFIITLDPENDTPSVLRRFKKKWGIEKSNWHYLRASEAETRKYAAKLGLGDYWKMDDHIQHGFKIMILDPTQSGVKTLDWDHRDVTAALK